MANYVEQIKVANGESWPVRDAEAHASIGNILAELPNKAPAGYGLGYAEAKPWSDIDNITSPGWYAFHDSVVIDGNNFGSGGMRVDAFTSTSLIQTFYPNVSAIPMVELKRQYIGGVWYPWEWVNPPVEIGVEYRTTERWNNKAVYTKLIDLGLVPSGNKTVEIGVNGVITGGLPGLIRHYAFVNTGRSVLPNETMVGDWEVSVNIHDGIADITGGVGIGSNNELLYLQVWYIYP